MNKEELIEEAEGLTYFQLRAKIRTFRKFFTSMPICKMKRSECLGQYKIFLEMKEKFDKLYADGFEKTKPMPRKIPVKNEIVEDIELKIPDVPPPRGYMRSKEINEHDK